MSKFQGKIRYAVVGLGHIAQTAVLPAFKNASRNSEITALVSSDPRKRKTLGKRYRTEITTDYAGFERLLESGMVDAVYIATPNTCHTRFADLAAKHGVHILCEKPLATTSAELLRLDRVVEKAKVKFMTAYRLHFDPANLEAINQVRKGNLGEIRFFNSTFSMQVRDKNNIRLRREMGGGPLFDIGIYCINASRYILGGEPLSVFARAFHKKEEARFAEVEEMLAVTMLYPNEKVANFVCSFGAADTSAYDVIGTKGTLRLENAYDYALPMTLTTTINEKDKTRSFAKHDQFAAELLYFSDCILKDRKVEPSLQEGLIDVRIIEAIQKSCATGKLVHVQAPQKQRRPQQSQAITRPGITPPPTVNAPSPS